MFVWITCNLYYIKMDFSYQLYVLYTLENESSEPVEEVLRHRFCNRYPQTETIGLGLRHRVFHPVP